jgi:homoserine kinase
MNPLTLKLPATSANLGPGFDALGLAMSLFLNIEAFEAPRFHIEASGRNAQQIAQLEDNLILATYRQLAPNAPPLQLNIRNQIPLGMGCGSSAAALLAGVHLANHFGRLNLTAQQVLEEACVREGHPDNVAACFHGGLTVSSMRGREVISAALGHKLNWRLLLAIPAASLSTKVARSLLPDTYSRADAVENIQATALLVSAFALDQPELLAAATRDRLHQPYRSIACPLLPKLLPLAGASGIHSVTLSGAGPSVLLIADSQAPLEGLRATVLGAAGHPSPELVETTIFISTRPRISSDTVTITND